MTRVGDLIDVPEIRTVIQLRDLRDSHLRRMILSSFVVTEEVLNSLRSTLSALSGPEGRGIFLKGNFGSGKSHFLSMLSLVLRQPENWGALLEQTPELKESRGGLGDRQFLVVEISLIQHRGTEFLEDIFLGEIFRELSSRLGETFEGTDSRPGTFEKIGRTVRRLGLAGLVLLVDELSEFLRSKTDPHAYNEDIRFLQYLGEEASSFPLWVVASLQEWIEETGEINQETFNKIKDRYPVRITLGRAHIEELVSHRLIRHREGAKAAIREIYSSLRSYFPSFPVDEARFSRLYPVHPATVALLDRLKPLFSEHRGIIDFIHYRLKGDAQRGIPSFLDRPAEELLGPAAIFDHFLQRIRETAETQPFLEKAFQAYQDEIPEIFKDPDQQKVALEAVKILVLLAMSPVKIRYTVRHLAEMILFRVTPLDEKVNYDYLRDILERLQRESSYLAVIPGKDRLDDQIAIDLKADIQGIVRRKIRQGAAEIYPGDRRLFDRLIATAESPHLPFAGWAEQRRQKLSLPWEYTSRSGLLMLRQVDEMALAEAQDLGKEWERMEEDFFLIVATTHKVHRQYEHLRQVLLPDLREKHPGKFLFWLPAEVSEEEEKWQTEFLAALLLLERYREDSSETGQRAREYLQHVVSSGRKRAGEILTRAYFHGRLLWDERQAELAPFGYLSQEKFLLEFAPALLTRRFPRHERIHPYMEVSPNMVPGLIRDFFSTGAAEIDDKGKFGLRAVLEGMLKPMGLLRKKSAHEYFLQVDPRKNELAEHCCALLENGPQPLENLYWALRKGEYGLVRTQFEFLVLALLFSGNLVAYQGQRKRGLEEISRGGLQGITALGKGEILGAELRAAISVHPLIPEKLRKGSLTLPSQEGLWNEVKTRKEKEAEGLRNLLHRLRWASAFQAFKNLPWESLRRDLEDVLAQWEEVKVSFPVKEGLERFLSAAAREPFLEAKLQRIAELRGFFDVAERLLFVYGYLSDARLRLPDRAFLRELRTEKEALLGFFTAGQGSIDGQAAGQLLERFQVFREKYVQVYAEAHRRARSGEQFAPYEKLRQSRRYQLLARLDQLEMISVQHNRTSVDRALSTVLMSQCNGPALDALQSSPVCSCGFLLDEEKTFQPARGIEEAVDSGIRETLEALHSPTYEEKLLPYLAGLEGVEDEKAAAVRRLLSLPEVRGEDLLPRLEEALTPLAIQGINEAFRGRVVVVRRNLDQLYSALIGRKYSLAQMRKILREWLREEEIGESTFVQFTGQREAGEAPQDSGIAPFLESAFPHLLPLLQEGGERLLGKALLLSLWIERHGIAPREIFPLFPFLKKGPEERGEVLVRQLAEAARRFSEQEPARIESLVGDLEREEGLPAELWKLLAPRPPLIVFRRETIFPSVLREAWERILTSPAEEAPDQGAAAAEGPPALLARKEEMTRVWQGFLSLRQKISILGRKEGKAPADFQKWESLYTQQLSPAACLCALLPGQARRLELSLPKPAADLLARARDQQEALCADFSRFYREALPGWAQGEGKRPKRIEDLPSLGARKGNLAENRIYVLMDGMRWDLWTEVKEKFLAPLGNQWRIVQEGALWAHDPTNTPRQMESLQNAFGEKTPEMWKINGIDERVHTEKGSLEHLFGNILQYLKLELAPRLREVPPSSQLLLFADHGFIENPQFEKADKYRASRYTHGGDSPFEVIVPWALLTRIP